MLYKTSISWDVCQKATPLAPPKDIVASPPSNLNSLKDCLIASYWEFILPSDKTEYPPHPQLTLPLETEPVDWINAKLKNLMPVSWDNLLKFAGPPVSSPT